jgi:peptide-methionine (S)-S-oxide reductase
MKTEKAIFGAGCFWKPQAIFDKTKGVLKTTVGFMGGTIENPSYDDVCTNKTGHVEVVQVEFDPSKISYEKLLDIFWNNHDPTQIDRQGPDMGIQYKSVIFYTQEDQKHKAEKSKKEQQKILDKKIATEIRPALKFYEAEEYHQKYYEKHNINKC